jgi:uncharacterized RDD family membrane protein YckC
MQEAEMNQVVRWEPPVIGQYAGFVTRGVALVIDIGVVAIISTVIGMASSLISSMFPQQSWTHDLLTLTTGILIVVVGIGYYLVGWTLVGQTVGKYVMGVRVVNVQGEPISMRAAVVRYFGYYLSALAFFCGFLWALVDDERRAWHDHLARSMVVYAWPEPKVSRRGVRLTASQGTTTSGASVTAEKR